MSPAWMRMPGEPWLEVAASFMGMWLAMMIAMMLPCLVPMLLRYRRTIATRGLHLERLTLLVGAGYFFVWIMLGMAFCPLGFGVASFEMQQPALARAVPFTTGLVVLLAGAIQFSAWKTRQLTRLGSFTRLGSLMRSRDVTCCQEALALPRTLLADSGGAWRYGVRLGLHCGGCCGNFMAVLLVVGIMDLRAMALVTGALTLERVAPDERIARAVGVAVIGVGLMLTARAIGLW